MKKITLCILLVMVILTVGCKQEPLEPERPPVVEQTDDEIIEMSIALNRSMFTIDDMVELGDIFDSYMDRMGEQTYLTHFNVKNILVSSAYYRGYGIDSYSVRDTIVNEDDKGTRHVYVAYELEGIYSDEWDGDLVYITLKGLNKYSYNNGKLVNLTKIL